MITIHIVGALSATSHPQIVNAAHQAVNDLPPEIQQALSAYKILVGRRIIDIKPEFADILPRGHVRNFRHTSAVMLPTRKEILVAQEALNKAATNYLPISRNRYHCYMHELGHSFDFDGETIATKSSRQEFKEAFKADLLRVKTLDDYERSWDLQEKFSYFFDRQSSGLGRQQRLDSARDEVFAEAFAFIVGGKNIDYDGGAYQRDHQAVFANCYKVVEEMIREVAPDFEALPTRKRFFPKIKEGAKVTQATLA